MNDRSMRHMLGKKTPPPYTERKKKAKFRFLWNKEQSIDYDKCKQIDVFIQDVIEKAKADYLETYSQWNGDCVDNIPSVNRDDCGQNDDQNDNKFGRMEDISNEDDYQLTGRLLNNRLTESSNGKPSEGSVELKELGKDSNAGERKPLIDRHRHSRCCSEGSICSRLLTLLTCYHCRCLQEILTES